MSATSIPDLGRFASTRWTLVLRAHDGSDEGRAALGDLCAAYYQPVLVFLRRSGWSADEASDLAHSFFAHLLQKGGLPNPDRGRGRFRNYLLGAVKHFVSDLRDRAHAMKRGGGVAHEALDAGDDESPALQVSDPKAASALAAFDREWALTAMNRAVALLEAEHEGPRAAHFEALRPWLMGDGAASHAETAAALGMSEGAVKVAVHRLRRRFRELLRQEVAQTLDDPAELDDELRHLCAVLG